MAETLRISTESLHYVSIQIRTVTHLTNLRSKSIFVAFLKFSIKVGNAHRLYYSDIEPKIILDPAEWCYADLNEGKNFAETPGPNPRSHNCLSLRKSSKYITI